MTDHDEHRVNPLEKPKVAHDAFMLKNDGADRLTLKGASLISVQDNKAYLSMSHDDLSKDQLRVATESWGKDKPDAFVLKDDDGQLYYEPAWRGDPSRFSSEIVRGTLFSYSDLKENASRFDRQKPNRLEIAQNIGIGAFSFAKDTTKDSVYGASKAFKGVAVDQMISEQGGGDRDLNAFDKYSKNAYEATKSTITTPNQTRKNVNRKASQIITKSDKKIEKLEKKAAKSFKKGEYKKSAKKLSKAQRKRSSRTRRVANSIARGSSARAALMLGGGFLLFFFTFIIGLSIITAIISSVTSINNDSGDMSAEMWALVAVLRDEGFSDAAIAGVLGNVANESGLEGAKNETNLDGLFNYKYERAIGLFQYTHASNSIPPSPGTCGCEYCNFKAWCSASGKSPYDASSQFEWTFGGENREGNWKSRWVKRTGYISYWSGRYSWINSSTLCSADEYVDLADPAKAAYCWMAAYEGCAYGEAAHLDRRIDSAMSYYAMLKSAPAASSSEVVARAYEELGKPYAWGASGPDAFDCSGLVGYCLTGRYGNHWCSTSTIITWPRVSASDAKPGDICVSSTHTGVYIGNGKMIHAPHTGDVVKIGDVQSNMVFVRYAG